MDSSIETGDPWEIPEQDADTTPSVGGLSPLAEATGLFSRSRAVPSGTELTSESKGDTDAATTGDGEEAADMSESGLDSDNGLFESALQDLEEPPTFELIPPASFEPEASEEFPASAHLEEASAVATESADPGEHPETWTPPASASVYEPPVDVPLDPWTDPADEAEEPVEIEFGAPQAPEGSELPTGKATVSAGEGTISRPVLLTTETVEGANVAPVDMVVSVESVADPSAVPSAVQRALEGLRDRCSEVGGEAVVAVTTSISNTGSMITIVAAGTAVNLL